MEQPVRDNTRSCKATKKRNLYETRGLTLRTEALTYAPSLTPSGGATFDAFQRGATPTGSR